MAYSRPSSEKSEGSREIAVAAIDFGTTCTGYAYWFSKGAKVSIREIGSSGQESTTVLLNANKQFDSFGQEAESKYKNLILEDKHREWHYFRHFKMVLHSTRDLSRETVLEDAESRPTRAQTIFTFAIKHVKNKLKSKLESSIGDKLREGDIRWVITVPAIWRDSAKQFMREAAEQAGVPSAQLSLALEPESAAIYCKELAINRTEGLDGAFLRAFDPGMKYLVLDLGGGTVDTTVHEVTESGQLKELHSATGGPWGGERVNQAFEQFVQDLFGTRLFTELLQHHKDEWIETEQDFEKVKCEFTPKKTTASTIVFPHGLSEYYKINTGKDLESILSSSLYKERVKLQKNHLFLEPKMMKEFFNTAIKDIVTHTKSLLQEHKLSGVSAILLVGGFAESPVVKQEMEKNFQKRMRIIVPEHASVAVLKGAVMFGRDPNIISARVSPYSYGVHTRKRFDPKVHPKEKKRDVGGRSVVNNCFDRHLDMGEVVYVGQTASTKRYTVINTKTTEVFWKVYKSEAEPPPIFCDEASCDYLGTLKAILPRSVKQEKITLSFRMTCKGTELKADVFDENSKTRCEGKFDFLAKEYAFASDVETDS